MQRSRLLEGFRAVGLVTYPLPAAIQKRGAENFITVSVKNGFQIFDTSRLRLLIVSSPRTPQSITSLASHGDLTFAAVGNNIHVYRRGKEQTVLTAHNGKVRMLFVFGSLLLSYSADGEVIAWALDTLEVERRIPLQEAGAVSGGGKAAVVTCWMHPSTYLNKMVLGDAEGGLHILNVRSGKCVHSFGALGSEVTALDQSPAVDVVGVGLSDGRVIVRNIKFDETIMTFRHTDGSVTGLSFRTDNTNMLASTSSGGGLHVWNLESEQLAASLPQAHTAAVCTCRFLQGEPLLITTGADNAVKMWIFDQDDGSARLLRFRCGHSAPPTRVKYYSQHHILSAGLDRSFRVFSTIQDQQSRELSQGRVVKKAKIAGASEEHVRLPPVVDFAASPMRENDWSNVITCHVDDGAVYTWRYKNAVIGKHVLKPPPLDRHVTKEQKAEKKKEDDDVFGRKGKMPGQIAVYVEKERPKGAPKEHERTVASAVCVTQCGNFGIVGYTCGRVDRYNLQSGIHRGTYWEGGHLETVYGVACDTLNEMLVSGSYDMTVKLWDFEKQHVLHTLSIGSPVNQMALNREGMILAVSGDDLKVRLFDLTTRKLVRVFEGHDNRITDVCMSPDGRWVVTVSADCTMRVYDVPSSRLIDWLRFDKVITGVCFSPTGDFVCTCHADSVGIYLWTNRAHFGGVFMGAASPEEATQIRLPTTAGEEEGAEVEGTQDRDAAQYPALIQQLEPQLVTFSTVPKPKWQTLANLDAIKERNKPIQPPIAPPQAPFFLPTMPGITPVFLPEEDGESEGQLPSGGSKILHLSSLRPQTKFVKELKISHSRGKGDYSSCLELLKDMSPSAIDLEIRSLSMEKGGTELVYFVDMLCEAMKRGRDFELMQAYLAAFLRIHETALMELPDLRDKTKELGEVQSSMWARLKGDFQQALCMVSAFSNIQ